MSRYTLRMQFGPHEDPGRVTRQLLELARTVPVDEVMVFFFAEELNDGHETIEQVKEWIARSRPYRRALLDEGIEVSLNPWHSVLHTDRGRRLKPGQEWRTMIDPAGRSATAVVCPLDEGWRAYYAETLELYAGEGFRVIWIDDDIRYHNHAPLEWGGCFCEAHVAEFNRRAGVDASRDEIVMACTAPGAPHPWRGFWMDAWEEAHLAMVAEWREIVEAGGSRLGLMSSDTEAHAAEGRRWADWWRALAGGNPPIHRPHYWGYSDTTGESLVRSIALLDQNRRLQPFAAESGPEIECFPYGRWNKSFRQTSAQMALAHVLGSSSLNISLYDFMGNDPDDEPARAAFLAEWRPALDALSEEFPTTLRSYGIGVPFSEDMGRTIRTTSAGRWQSLVCPSRGWASWLGAAGLAFMTVGSDTVNALAGQVAWAFPDEDLERWLARALLLDGEAAAILVERGFGDLIGVGSGEFMTQEGRLYSIERCTHADFALRTGAQISVNVGSHAARLFQADLAPDARLISELRNPRQDIIGHGMYRYDNRAGGRVAVAPWSANGDVPMSIQRAAQLRAVIEYLCRGAWPGAAEGWPWLVPQFLTDGTIWRGVVWNASPDAVDTITVRAPSAMPEIRTAEHVDARGRRTPATFAGDRIELASPLHQWEFVILKP